MKTIFMLSLLFSAQAFSAPDCKKQVAVEVLKAEPRHDLGKVSLKKTLKPGEEIFYKDYDFTNNYQHPVDVYLAESFFMAKFVHMALVKNPGCKVLDLVEVDFE